MSFIKQLMAWKVRSDTAQDGDDYDIEDASLPADPGEYPGDAAGLRPSAAGATGTGAGTGARAGDIAPAGDALHDSDLRGFWAHDASAPAAEADFDDEDDDGSDEDDDGDEAYGILDVESPPAMAVAPMADPAPAMRPARPEVPEPPVAAAPAGTPAATRQSLGGDVEDIIARVQTRALRAAQGEAPKPARLMPAPKIWEMNVGPATTRPAATAAPAERSEAPPESERSEAPFDTGPGEAPAKTARNGAAIDAAGGPSGAATPPFSDPAPSHRDRPAGVSPLPRQEPPPAGRVKTRLLGFHHPGAIAADPFEAEPAPPARPLGIRFPTGWLVVVAGPGRGESFTLAAGVSQIGRGEDQAIRLDFGDMSISRNNHAAIAFDDELGKFYLGHGGKLNLVRLNDRPVLSTEELNSGDLIRLGETTLKFVAFCGDGFTWGQPEHRADDAAAG